MGSTFFLGVLETRLLNFGETIALVWVMLNGETNCWFNLGFSLIVVLFFIVDKLTFGPLLLFTWATELVRINVSFWLV